LEWKKLVTKNFPCVSKQRQGHTCCIYNHKLYFYGGKAKAGEFTFFPDLEIYDIQEKNWLPPILTTNVLKARKNHTANIIGNQMIVYGGVTEDNQYLGDVFTLNLDTLKFSSVFVNDDTPGQHVAYHSACVVAPKEVIYSVKNHLYTFENQQKNKIFYPSGLYVFGGKTNDFTSTTNDIYLLTIGRKPSEWHKMTVTTSGKAPCARYFCSLSYYEEGSILILHGGKRIVKEDEDLVLDDTYILNLHKMEWYSVSYYFPDLSYKIFSRFAHNCLIFTDKLIIFGGGSEEKLLGSMMLIINLNNSKVSQLASYHQITENFIEQGRVGKDKLEHFKKNKRKISMVNVVKLPMLQSNLLFYD
jgi:hypothetical protein